jgi:hypothetical protein
MDDREPARRVSRARGEGRPEIANDLRISGASSNPRSEADIRVNTRDPSKIVAASNDTGSFIQAQFASTDGGANWSQTTLPLATGDALHSDPAVDWTSDGTAWAITIGIDASGTILKLRAYKSTDNGATWTLDSTPSGTQTNVDREIMWVDHIASSPHVDQMYVTWHNGTPVFFARRTTGASAAWQTPIQVSGSETTGIGIGGDVKSNANGDVFVFWQDADGSRKIYLAKSTDGGVTFGSVITIASIFASSRKISIPADSGRKTRVYVSGGCWRTGSKDLVYAVWADLSGDSGCTSGSGPGTSTSSTCKSRVWFARSTDGGATWGAPKKLNDQSSLNDQCFPRLAVDEADGKLVVTYYDTVNDSGRKKTDIWTQSSTDDGVTWSSATQVTSAQTDETAAGADSGNQYGDYTGLSGFGGIFFPAWTDRRSGGAEEIWTAPLRVVAKALTFVVERSTLGQDEIDARRALGSAVVPDAFRVVVDGFTASELGLAGSGSTLAVASPIAGMSVNCTGNTAETGGYGPLVQRFTFHYDLDFGATDTAFSFAADTEFVTLNASAGGLSAAAELELIKQPDPFILHGDPAWLSVDLRVFVVRAGETRFGVTMGADGSAAPGFIQAVMSALSAGGGSAGGQSFDSLPTAEDASRLFVQPTDAGGTAVFNFALAKVHYIGLIGASDVRLFFRLFQAQSTSATYDFPPGAHYRRAPTNPAGQPIPLPGIQGNEYVTIPCFATPRVDSSTQALDQQTDPPNVQTFTAHADGSEVDRFYGCWLDINQPFTSVLPAQVPAGNPDGPYSDPSNPPLSLQQAIVRSPHQCLIAEIAFDPVAIPPGKDPGNWDKLAQRNIAWSDLGSARAVTTFELQPTPQGAEPPDELMIDWGALPAGTHASLYLPSLEAAQSVALAERLYGGHRLSVADAHTLRLQAGGISYVPLPPGGEHSPAGLLTLALPERLRGGERFDVVVRQLTNAYGKRQPPPPPPPRLERASLVAGRDSKRIAWRQVVGSFQLTVPVSTKELLLEPEERLLSVMRWIGEAIPRHSRWHPVFLRYLAELAGRVSAFGGDPTTIGPSPTGEGGKRPPRPHRPGHGATGKVAGLVFDHWGDFEGFELESEHGRRRFRSRERDVFELAERAWRERLRLTVYSEPHEPERPRRIVVREPPTAFVDRPPGER